MYKSNKLLAIIPAKSNSKGIKNKNIKLLNNKPLIFYSIDAAIKSKIFDTIFVSTDSKNYKKITENYGIKVPFLRPKNISRDTSKSEKYILHALNRFKVLGKTFNFFAVLQPTSPFRTAKDIKNAADIIIDEKLDSVVSVCKSEHPKEYFFELSQNLSLYKKSFEFNRQKCKKTYRLNGALYFANCESFLKKKSFYVKKSRAYIMPRKRSVDIDTTLDLEFAEFLFSKKKNLQK
ncbi:MAG: acylneuraminate cytidylyltransferase family protein [Oscillospiraceae bacterium]|nr:acylneuraminate cytidylyltransferase family protein [Oscillospiraceae bacterium]